MVEREVGYKRTYKMRKLVPKARYLSVGLPYEVVEREAAIRNMTVAEFIEKFVVEAEYNNFEGVHYTFVKGVRDES